MTLVWICRFSVRNSTGCVGFARIPPTWAAARKTAWGFAVGEELPNAAWIPKVEIARVRVITSLDARVLPVDGRAPSQPGPGARRRRQAHPEAARRRLASWTRAPLGARESSRSHAVAGLHQCSLLRARSRSLSTISARVRRSRLRGRQQQSTSSACRSASTAQRRPPRSVGSTADRDARAASSRDPAARTPCVTNSRTECSLAGGDARSPPAVSCCSISHIRLDVVLGVAPVAQGFQITEIERVLQPDSYPRGRAGDLSGDERLAAERSDSWLNRMPFAANMWYASR